MTGDLGELDADGSLRIVGRKKEMFVLATGKKVAPTQVETCSPARRWIEQACVLGDGRKCLAALIVPNGDALREGNPRAAAVGVVQAAGGDAPQGAWRCTGRKSTAA